MELRQGPLRVPLPDVGGPDHPADGPRTPTACCAETSWTDAHQVAAAGLLAARDNGGIGVLAGGRLTVDDAYAYAKFARLAAAHQRHRLPGPAALGRGARRSSPRTSSAHGPERRDLHARWRRRPPCCCVALEPEEESPILFLRLRKAARKPASRSSTSAQWTTPAVERTAVELALRRRRPPGTT